MRRRVHFVSITFVLILTSGIFAYELEGRFFPPDSGYPSTPAVGDIDHDGVPEIVFGTVPSDLLYSSPAGPLGGHLYVISKDASDFITMESEMNLGEAVYSPAIGDLDGDGTVEIVVCVWDSTTGKVVAVHPDGTVFWSTTTHLDYGELSISDNAPALGDVNGDGVADVALIAGPIYADATHPVATSTLVVLSGVDGTELWRDDIDSTTSGMALWAEMTAIMDIDRDGNNEVLASICHNTYPDRLKVYRSDGTVWWSADAVGNFGVADFDLDGNSEIIGAKDNEVALFSYDGTLIATCPTPGVDGLAGFTIADFDGDGFPEAAIEEAIGDTASHVLVFDYDPSDSVLSLLWDSGDVGLGEWDNPDLTSADFSCDGIPDIIAISDDRALVVLNGETGETIEPWTVSIDENEHSPALADVDGDGYGEVVVPSGNDFSIAPPDDWATYNCNILIFGNDGVWGYTRTFWTQMSFWQSNVDENLCPTGGDYTPWLNPITNMWRSFYCYPQGIDIYIWFSEETDCNDSNIVEICYNLVGDTADVNISMSSDSGTTWIEPGTAWFSTLWDTVGVWGDSIAPHDSICFYWFLSSDVPDSESCDWMIMAIATIDTLADTSIFTDCLDSRPPEVHLLCDSAVSVGDTVHLEWNVEDMFWNDDPCSLHIYGIGCSYDTAIAVADTFCDWGVPSAVVGCDSLWFVVAARDSFCNWGYDSCAILVCNGAQAMIDCAPCGEFTGCFDQIVQLTIIDLDSIPIDTMRVYLTLEVFHSDATADTFLLGEPSDSLSFTCFADTVCSRVTVTVSGFEFENGDSVWIALDSLYDEAGCFITDFSE